MKEVEEREEEGGVTTESSFWHQLQRGQEGAEPDGGNPPTSRNSERGETSGWLWLPLVPVLPHDKEGSGGVLT